MAHLPVRVLKAEDIQKNETSGEDDGVIIREYSGGTLIDRCWEVIDKLASGYSVRPALERTNPLSAWHKGRRWGAISKDGKIVSVYSMEMDCIISTISHPLITDVMDMKWCPSSTTGLLAMSIPGGISFA